MQSFHDFKPALRLLLGGMDRAVAWRLGATNLLAVAGGLLAGLAPLALKGIIDSAAGVMDTPEQSASVAALAATYLLCLCAGRLLMELRPVLISAAEQRLYRELRRGYFRHLLALPLAFHLERRTGSVVQVLQQAISGYQVIMFSLVHSVVPVLVEAVTVTLVLIALGQPALTATFVATAVAYFAAMGFRTAELSVAAQAVSNTSIAAQGLLSDGLINYEPIKCFGAERSAIDGFDRSTSVLEQCWGRLQRLRLKIGVVVTAIFVLSMTASLMFALQAVAQGTLSIGGFVLANVYMLQVVRPLEMLSTATRDVAQGLAFIRPLLDVFGELPETTRTSGQLPVNVQESSRDLREDAGVAQIVSRQAPRISFRGVQLTFDAGEPVLTDFSLDIPAGRSMAIVGASGCGKSSLVRLLLRLCEPQAGSILLDGIEISALPLAALRSMVAVVPQDVVLFNTTIAANIGIGKDGATTSAILRAARLAELHDFITALPAGYSTVIGERGLKLSGGERQRIAIARAILRDPLVYVFDEATSMLDGATECAILHNLKKISAGRTTLTIAHRLSAIQHADEIAVLAGGRVIEQGDHATLLDRDGPYAAMWRAQQASGST